jgi:hypothetical protein
MLARRHLVRDHGWSDLSIDRACSAERDVVQLHNDQHFEAELGHSHAPEDHFRVG